MPDAGVPCAPGGCAESKRAAVAVEAAALVARWARAALPDERVVELRLLRFHGRGRRVLVRGVGRDARRPANARVRERRMYGGPPPERGRARARPYRGAPCSGAGGLVRRGRRRHQRRSERLQRCVKPARGRCRLRAQTSDTVRRRAARQARESRTTPPGLARGPSAAAARWRRGRARREHGSGEQERPWGGVATPEVRRAQRAARPRRTAARRTSSAVDMHGVRRLKVINSASV